MVQAPRTSRRHRIDLAINHALERRWDLAAEANRALLQEDESDVESANRLGKALTELGDVKRAIEAYEQALRIEPTNAIARKNLARLEEQRKAKRGTKATKPPAKAKGRTVVATAPRRIDVAAESLRTSPLIEERGKSADLVLQRVNLDAASDVSVGDEAVLEPTASGVSVKSTDGITLGHIEPRIGLRIKRMMEGGNRYSVIIRRAEGESVVVHVRETFKHPSLVGQASFLPPATDARRRTAPRAYTKTSVVRYERGDDVDDGDDEEEWSVDGDDGDDDFEDSTELGEELGGGDAGFDDDDSSDDSDPDDDD